MNRITLLILSVFLFSAHSVEFRKKNRPTLFVIGDSTVKNGSGKGNSGLWGWGDFLYEKVDTTKIRIENHARGGRSSRTYLTEGLWDKVMERIKPGDFLILQFGHNDSGKVNDSTRARGSLKGNGEETEEIDNMLTNKHEIVHTYGWYIRKYVADAKSKGATTIVCSPVARNVWKDGKVDRATESYTRWASEAAQATGAYFIDLNDIVASHYEQTGEAAVKEKFFLQDHTHTTKDGAELNVVCVVEGLKKLKNCPLNKYLKKE